MGRWEGVPFSPRTSLGGSVAARIRCPCGGGGRWCTDPWKDFLSKCGVPTPGGATREKPPLDISATDLARRTVVAPLMTDGGTEEGPAMERAGAGGARP